MNGIIACKGETELNCPYLETCVARVIDPRIEGCGIVLYKKGLISKEETLVMRLIRKEEPHDN